MLDHINDIFDIITPNYNTESDEDLAWLMLQPLPIGIRNNIRAELARRANIALRLAVNADGDVINLDTTVNF